jgi:hypothetical protein
VSALDLGIFLNLDVVAWLLLLRDTIFFLNFRVAKNRKAKLAVAG